MWEVQVVDGMWWVGVPFEHVANGVLARDGLQAWVICSLIES